MKTRKVLSFAAVLAATVVSADSKCAGTRPSLFSVLSYNTPGTAFIKAGLFAWPMVMDYDGDGDLDIVVRSHGVPARHHGTWLFENTGKPGDRHPLFKPARRLGDEGWAYGGANAQTLADGRLAVTGPGVVAFDFRENGMRHARTFAGLPKNVHENKVRGNVWRFADLDGDGKEDLTVGVGDWKEYGWENAWDSAGCWTNGPLYGYVYFIRNESGPDGKEKWGRPEKIRMANGAPIDVYGSAAPLFADWDGDGDLDLLTCDFVDSYTYFENIGTKTEPRFACGRPILDKFLRPIKADLCMVTATVADWDGDGFPDLIACEEDARVCLIRNAGRVAMGVPVFEAPYWFRQTERDHVHFGILVTPSVIDWDGDGDEDIITGNSAGYVAFIENLSGRGEAEPLWAEPVLLEADGAPIRIIAGPNGSIQGPCEAKWGYTCLSTGDWDGDGLPDVMLNSIRGEVVWCRNIGTRTAPRLAPPAPVSAEWEGRQPELAWGWMKPNGSKNILTQWRTTPLMYDMNRDGLMDLVMVDTEGFLAFWERARTADGRLILKPPRRAFIDDATGEPMGVSGWKGDGKGRAGASGRRKLCLADWDGDGKPDLIMNSENAVLWHQVRAADGCWRFARQGNLADEKLAGHTTSPCACDFDGDGVADLLVGAEDGFFYHLANPSSKSYGGMNRQ